MSVWSTIPIRLGKGLSCLGLLLGLAACNPAPPPPQTVRFLLANEILSLDPAQATDATSERVQQLLYRALVGFDETFQPVADLAQWQVLSPTHYRYTLRSTPPEATTVAHFYRQILDPAQASPHRQLLTGIQSIDVISSTTLDFHLYAPDALFTSYLTLGIPPPGQGAYVPGPEELTLIRRRDGLHLQLRTVKDPTLRVLKLVSGEAELLQGDLPFELWGYLRQQPGLQVIQRPGNNFSYLGFNLRDPVAGQLAVRQAIAHALDKASIIRYLFQDAARPAASILPSGHWASDPHLSAPAYDPDRARMLLARLGYSPEYPLTLQFKTSSDPFRLRLATVYQAQLAAVGIRLQVQSYDWGTFYADIKAGRFQLYSLTWTGVKTPDMLRYAFHSSALPPQGANRGYYQNPRFDALLAQAQASPDQETQAGLYRQAQAILLEDLPYVPLWYEDYLAAHSTRVSGYAPRNTGTYDALNDLQLTP